jgi:hypothetical protein
MTVWGEMGGKDEDGGELPLSSHLIRGTCAKHFIEITSNTYNDPQSRCYFRNNNKERYQASPSHSQELEWDLNSGLSNTRTQALCTLR